MTDAVASILSSGLGAVGGFLGGIYNAHKAEKLSDKQFQQSLYIQDKTNAYNSPVAQMDRLRSAGLNPNMIYGQNGGIIQSASASPAQQPNVAPISIESILAMARTMSDTFLQQSQIQAQKDLQKSQIQANKEVESTRIQAQKDLQVEQNTFTATENRLNRDAATEAQDKQLKQQDKEFFAKLGQDFTIAQWQNAIAKQDLDIRKYLSHAEYSNLMASASVNSVEAGLKRIALRYAPEMTFQSLQALRDQNLMNKLYNGFFGNKDDFRKSLRDYGHSDLSVDDCDAIWNMYKDIVSNKALDARSRSNYLDWYSGSFYQHLKCVLDLILAPISAFIE